MTFKNPFTKAEPLTKLFESDPNYNSLKQQKYFEFKKYRASIKQKSYTFWKMFAGSFLIISSLISTQVMAQDQFKPTEIVKSLFSNNKQSDSDPNLPLTKDSKNAVVALPICGMVIKYPTPDKQHDLELETHFQNKYNDTNTWDEDATLITKENSQLSVGCRHKYTKYGMVYLEENPTLKQKLTNEQVINDYGWFVGLTDIDSIYLISISLDHFDGENIIQNYNEYKHIYYEKGEYVYSIKFENRLVEANEIQVQFADQITNPDPELAKSLEIPQTCSEKLGLKPTANKPFLSITNYLHNQLQTESYDDEVMTKIPKTPFNDLRISCGLGVETSKSKEIDKTIVTRFEKYLKIDEYKILSTSQLETSFQEISSLEEQKGVFDVLTIQDISGHNFVLSLRKDII